MRFLSANDMKFKQQQILFGALALLSGCAAPQVAPHADAAPQVAAPTFISTGQGRGADLNVRGGAVFAADNFGDHEILRVRNCANIGDARKTYLRFDLATLPSPVKDATGATLGLRIAPAEGKSAPGKVWTFNVFGLKDARREDATRDEDWGEKEANWNTAPANDPTSASALKTQNVTSLGTFSIIGTGVAGQTISFGTPALVNFLKSDSNGKVTLIITRQEAGEGSDNDVMHIFSSKENAIPAPPVLSVAFRGENAALPTNEQWAKLPVASKPLPFEADIAAFEAQDLKTPPSKGGVVFVGSSSIRMWSSLAQDFPGAHALNRGFGGSHIADSANFAQRIVTPYKPKMIVFYAGTNDIADGKSPETLLADYMAFVAGVRAKLPTTPIAFISVSPAPSRWDKRETIQKTNSLIAQFSRLVPNLKFIDIYPLMLDANGKPRPELFQGDQLHMNPQGYAIWTKAVAPYLPKP